MKGCLFIINWFYFFSLLFQEGDLDMLSSDHSPTTPELKRLDDGDFLKAWGGISCLQVCVYCSKNLTAILCEMDRFLSTVKASCFIEKELLLQLAFHILPPNVIFCDF